MRKYTSVSLGICVKVLWKYNFGLRHCNERKVSVWNSVEAIKQSCVEVLRKYNVSVKRCFTAKTLHVTWNYHNTVSHWRYTAITLSHTDDILSWHYLTRTIYCHETVSHGRYTVMTLSPTDDLLSWQSLALTLYCKNTTTKILSHNNVILS